MAEAAAACRWPVTARRILERGGHGRLFTKAHRRRRVTTHRGHGRIIEEREGIVLQVGLEQG